MYFYGLCCVHSRVYGIDWYDGIKLVLVENWRREGVAKDHSLSSLRVTT